MTTHKWKYSRLKTMDSGRQDHATTTSCHTLIPASQRACSWSASLPGRLLLPRLLRPTLPSRSLWLVGSNKRRRRDVAACLALTNRINSPCSLSLRASELLELWRVRVIYGSAFDSAAQVAQHQHDQAKGGCANANVLGPIGGVSIRVQRVRAAVAKAERIHGSEVSERSQPARLLERLHCSDRVITNAHAPCAAARDARRASLSLGGVYIPLGDI